MKPPRFTDTARQPEGGYIHSDYSDIRGTLERARAKLRKCDDPLEIHLPVDANPASAGFLQPGSNSNGR